MMKKCIHTYTRLLASVNEAKVVSVGNKALIAFSSIDSFYGGNVVVLFSKSNQFIMNNLMLRRMIAIMKIET